MSPEKVYRGEPSKVTWSDPSCRVIVPSVPVTPGPAVGVVPEATVRAGQVLAQPVLQLLVPGESFVNL